MNVLIDDVFMISPAEYESLYFDEAFNEASGRAMRMGRALLHFERTSERIVRKVQYEPDRDPDSPAGKAFGTTRASFIEELDYDVRARKGVWRTIPNLLPDRVSNRGTIEFVEAPGGVRRIVCAEVKITLLGFGRMIERMVVREIVKSYERTTAFTNEWLAKR
jgi:hypothetical protein